VIERQNAPMPASELSERTRESSTSAFAMWVVGATVLGLVVRLGYVFGPARNRPLGGDPAYYHGLAKVLAGGHGFIEPLEYVVTGKHVPSATHPPLFPLALAVFTKLGLGTALDQRVVTSIIGVAVVPLAALAARRIMGVQAGVIVAILAAANPAFWMNDVNVLSEALLAPLIAMIVLVAVSKVPKSVPWRAALLGALIALATLTRAESALLLPLLAVPVVWHKAEGRRQQLMSIGAATGALIAVLAPWTAYNLSRFDKPVLVSNNFGGTLASANCDRVYYGARTGWWQFGCEGSLRQSPEESVRDGQLRRHATHYVQDHLSRLPVVVAARIGREWDVWQPVQTVRLDGVEGRALWPTRLGLLVYALIVLLAIPGVMWLRRTRAPIAWFVAPLILATIAAAAFYGSPRFRVPADVVLTIAAGIGVVALRESRSPRSRAR
jgi:4-amino-4-deoxy-L-arabinose transferase-like glycosyltransferase